MPRNTNGEVRYSQGVTLNLGNFESQRIDVGITLPILDDTDPEDALAACVHFVEKELSKQLAEAKGEAPAKRKTPSRKKKARKGK